MIREAQKIADAFAKANGFVCPQIQDCPYLHKRLGVRLSTGCIGIRVDKCHGPVGEVEDESVIGVAMHEVAHEWHLTHPRRAEITTAFMVCEPISMYGCVNTLENIAETMRLFILNPQLLECVNPYAYETALRFAKEVPQCTSLSSL